MDWNKDRVMVMADCRIINYSGKPLCENYRSPLERCRTAAQAIRLYKNCISWALQECYPTKEELLSFASKETLAENGVFIDRNFNGERIDGHVCCVFLGCSGWIRTGLNVDKAIIPALYLSEGSDLKVKVDAGLMRPVAVELYYNSKVGGNRKKLSVKDCNKLTAQDNTGFPEEDLAIDPEIDNLDL